MKIEIGQQAQLTDFLNHPTRDRTLWLWLVEWGLDRDKAHVLARVVLPVLLRYLKESRNVAFGPASQKAELAPRIALPYLSKFLSRQGDRSAKWLENTLKEAFNFFDPLVDGLAHHALKTIVGEAPPGPIEMEPLLSWIEELNAIDLLVWSFGDRESTIRLRLEPPQPELELRPDRLLHPSNMFIFMFSRKHEIQLLRQWRNTEDSFGWRVISGGGGVGKNRLAQEFARSSLKKNWHCGFINSNSLKKWLDHPQFARWAPVNDTLIIVNSAAYHMKSLKKLFQRCVEWEEETKTRTDSPRLRILLLERHAHPESGWLESLRTDWAGPFSHSIQTAMKSVLELKPPGRDDPEATTTRILQSTFNRWERLNEKQAPPFPEIDEHSLRQLRIHTQGRPLFLQLSGLHACETGKPEDMVHWDRETLLRKTVELQRRFIRSQCPEPDRVAWVERAAALLFLTGSRPQNELATLEFLERESQAFGTGDIPVATLISDLLHIFGGNDPVQRSQQDMLHPIPQDPIGAAFSVTVLNEKPDLLNDSLMHIVNLGRMTAWNNLMRTAQDLHGTRSLNIEHWLPPLLYGRPIEELLTIQMLLPPQSPALAGFGTTLIEAIKFFADSDESLARLLGELSGKYHESDKPVEAVEAARQSVQLLQKLAGENPDAYRIPLAKSLGDLGALHANANQPGPGLSACKRSVQILKSLDDEPRERTRPQLAKTLSSLSGLYFRLKNGWKAAAAEKSAAELYQSMAEDQPEAYKPGQGESLIRLSQVNLSLGRFDEALPVAKEAVGIFSDLAEDQPDAFEPHYARSLENLATVEHLLKNKHYARQAIERSVALYRNLARFQPEQFELALAQALRHYARTHFALAEPEKAEDAIREAIRIFERLPQKESQVLMLGDSWNELGNYSRAQEKSGQAAKAHQKALELFQQMDPVHPLLNQRRMQSYDGLSEAQKQLGNGKAALEYEMKMLNLQKTSATESLDPEKEFEIAAGLDDLALLHFELGNWQEGLDTCRQVEEIYERLSLSEPAQAQPRQAANFKMMSAFFRKLESPQESMWAHHQAIDLYRTLADLKPNLYQSRLAECQGALGEICYKENDFVRARDLFEQAIINLRDPFNLLPQSYVMLMENLIGYYFNACQALGVKPVNRLVDPIIEKISPAKTSNQT